MLKCGNCNRNKSDTPRTPEAGECDCLAWTNASLGHERQRLLIRQTQKSLGAIQQLSYYPIAMLDCAHEEDVREAVEVLARFSRAKLEQIGKPAEPVGPTCPNCDSTGILSVDGQEHILCDCAIGQALLKE